ncbi:MAG: hypothetical protein ABFD60_01620 [Bryobacteraceae bacterium]
MDITPGAGNLGMTGNAPVVTTTVWTYDATKLNDPTLGPRYQVRLLIRDTVSTRPLLDDAEIDWLLTQESNVYMAAVAACESLVAAKGSVKSKKVNDLSVDYDVSFYQSLAASLRARGMSGQVPFAGGISVGDKEVQQTDSDAVQPRLFRGLADNAGANNPGPGANDNPLTRTP